jgi:hypothetical protein
MSFNRPVQIYYGGKVFSVKYTTNPLKTEDTWGYVDFGKNEILIYTKGIQEISIAETLLHECWHIVMEYAGLGGSTEGDMPTPTNEYLTALCGCGNFMLHAQNPDLIAYLNEVLLVQ